MTAAHRDSRHSLFRLDHPAFGDERQQRIWMEAYVGAYEVAQLAAVTVAAAMIWIGGQSLMWWSLAVVWIIGLGNWAALSHLKGAGLTDLPWRDRLRFWTFRVRLLILAAWAIGFGLAAGGESRLGASDLDVVTVVGIFAGATGTVVALALIDRRTRARSAELQEDEVER